MYKKKLEIVDSSGVRIKSLSDFVLESPQITTATYKGNNPVFVHTDHMDQWRKCRGSVVAPDEFDDRNDESSDDEDDTLVSKRSRA